MDRQLAEHRGLLLTGVADELRGFNLAFLNVVQPNLPGVFEGHEFDAVNGALWTLKIEVMFYATVPVLFYLFRRLGRLPVIPAVYFLSLGYAAVMKWQAQRTGAGIWLELGRQLPGQLSYFMAGAFIYYFVPLFERRVAYFVAFAAAVFVARGYAPTAAFEPLALAILVAFFGLYQYAGNFGKYGDFSYGIYITHFPLIQIALHFGVFSAQPWLYLAFVVSATLPGAMLCGIWSKSASCGATIITSRRSVPMARHIRRRTALPTAPQRPLNRRAADHESECGFQPSSALRWAATLRPSACNA